MKLSLHVTDIDSYLWYQRIDSMTAEDMVARMKRTGPTNQQMLMGTAWHSVMESPPHDIGEIKSGGFTFKVECNACINLPQVREIRACKTYRIDGIDVTLTGGCDGISGNKIKDHKLTFKPNPENYFESYQWRAYLDIYKADWFEYIIYSAKEKNGVVTIYDVSTMSIYRYPGMVIDLESKIHDLVVFIEDNASELIRA